MAASLGELITRMSDDTLVFFHSWRRSAQTDPSGKQTAKLRIWCPKLGCFITIESRAEIARNLKAIRKTGIGFKKLP